MKNSKKFILAVNLVAFLGAVYWYYITRDLEPFVTSLALVGTFAGIYFQRSSIGEVKEFIESVAFERDFLVNLDPDHKKEALKYLIAPSGVEKSIYPNIGDYYEKYISQLVNIGREGYKTNFLINAKIFTSGENVNVSCWTSYRLFPRGDGYEDLTFGFINGENGVGRIKEVILCSMSGERYKFDESCFSVKEIDNYVFYKVEIPNDFKSLAYIDVSVRSEEEFGKNHAGFVYKFLSPVESFKAIISCCDTDELEVLDPWTFTASNKGLFIDKYNGGLALTYNGWVNHGEGLYVPIVRNKR